MCYTTRQTYAQQLHPLYDHHTRNDGLHDRDSRFCILAIIPRRGVRSYKVDIDAQGHNIQGDIDCTAHAHRDAVESMAARGPPHIHQSGGKERDEDADEYNADGDQINLFGKRDCSCGG